MFITAASNGIMNVSGWGILWTIVNILILFILLRIFLFKPVLKMMDERKKSVEDSLNNAAEKNKEADELKQQYEAALDNARKEASDIISNAKKEANAEGEKIVQEAKDKASKLIISANETIKNEKQKSLEAAQGELADIAISAAEKIVGKSLVDEANSKLLDDFLQEEGANN
jgi:F-type H+-transporting ATPase subunit b